MNLGSDGESVLVVGGGIAGLTAAQELAERGYAVTVRDMRSAPGGKARSTLVPHSGVAGRPDLPGEHGFRFFPGFYRNLIDTMERTPVGGGKTADQHLVEADRVLVSTEFGARPITLPLRVPSDPRSIAAFITEVYGTELLGGLEEGELEFFCAALWELVTSCADRRQERYGAISWLEFADPDGTKSERYHKLLVRGLTVSLVAAQAKDSNAKITGEILYQLMLSAVDPSRPALDRVLDGPTSEVWIGPWRDHLVERLGVVYDDRSRLVEVDYDERRGCIAGLVFEAPDGARDVVVADHYVLALPVERLAEVIRDTSLASVHDLAGIATLAHDVEWMNGLQIYLYDNTDIVEGHVWLFDSNWAITAISQQQFWPRDDLKDRGDGTVAGCVSVVISDWSETGNYVQSTARDASQREISEEVLAELRAALGSREQAWFLDRNVARIGLDPDIELRDPGVRQTATNSEPLFIATPRSWNLRPSSVTGVANLFLAGDWLQTETQLPCMESANESGRRAANGVLAASGRRDAVQTYGLAVPWYVSLLRRFDSVLYRRGCPYCSWLTGLVRVPTALLYWFAPLIDSVVAWWSRFRPFRWLATTFKRLPKRTVTWIVALFLLVVLWLRGRALLHSFTAWLDRYLWRIVKAAIVSAVRWLRRQLRRWWGR